MHKLFLKATFLIPLMLLFSCTDDNIYNFKELSQYDDYIIELEVYFEDINEDYSFTAIDYKTSGYDKFESWPSGKSGNARSEKETYNWAVKEYKRVGLKFIPETNIRRFRIQIYQLQDSDVIFQYYSEGSEIATVFYDFETAKDSVILE